MSKTTIFAFIFGAAVGAAVTWRIAATKFERMLDEEINNIYDDLEREKKSKEDEEDVEKPAEHSEERRTSKPINEKPDLMDKYAEVLKKTGYKTKEIEEGEESEMDDKPYVIHPDDFGEDGYECESLTYYADGVLTDDWDHPIEDVEGLVGVESLEHFGENDGDEDTVYVRNDRYKTDYEILRDNRNFSDIPKHDYTVHDE